ncbi:Putative zincin peptidase [Evansella caseinilytica]|uniref:Putative zincin peptidase n=1 Tax=Evansella caseinilytica TaxID=1503961 RepID=A0A1H3K163_9BACI|nr:DUF3267 domain-containing protein [Evansella caseinilytica]SDY45922.1 Putative zincin peptidase [Evansella caseinilytica]
MNCWKTISIANEFDKGRLWLLSALTMLIYFLLFFVIFSTFQPNTLFVDYGILFFILLILAAIPLHLFLHCLPIWLAGKRATFGVRKDQWPYFYYSTKEVLPKRLVLLAVCFPALVITAGSILITVLHPQWMHYTAIVSAFNSGMCVYDFLNVLIIKAAPKKSFVEEHRDGYHVLCRNKQIAQK